MIDLRQAAWRRGTHDPSVNHQLRRIVMTDAVAAIGPARMPSLALVPIVVLTFAITWGLVGF